MDVTFLGLGSTKYYEKVPTIQTVVSRAVPLKCYQLIIGYSSMEIKVIMCFYCLIRQLKFIKQNHIKCIKYAQHFYAFHPFLNQ